MQRWSGADWTILADGVDAVPDTVNRTNPSDPSLAVDSLGRPSVAWAESTALGDPRRVFVRRHDGSSLDPLGTGVLESPGPGADTSAPSIAVDVRNRVLVAVRGSSDGSEGIYVWRYRDSQ